jgi:superfamily II DNA or RNA helicase
MDKLTVKKKNQAFIAIDTEPYIENELSDFFCFLVPGYQFVPSYKNKMWDGKIRLYDSRKKELPIGLFEYLKEFIAVRDYHLAVEQDPWYGRPDSKIDLDQVSLSSYIDSLNLCSGGKRIAPRDYQFDAIAHSLINRNALLLSPTASGKSLIIYCVTRYLLDEYDKDILIVVPTTSLVEQMFGDFKDYAEYSDFDVDSNVHKIYAGKAKETNKKIVITTWQSIYNFPARWFERFGCVFGDEAHNFKAKSLGAIMSNLREAEYRIGTTGTLDGTKTHKLVLEGHFGPVYQVTKTRDLIDSGQISDVVINVLLLKYKEETRALMKKASYNEEIDFIVTNKSRNNFIKNLALDQDGNTLVLFNLVEKHGIPLYNIINENSGKGRKVFFVSGQTVAEDRENIRKIVEKEKDAIIVASLGTFSTGINIKNLHNIIFAAPSKSQIKILQSIGRGLRLSDDGRKASIYDIADDLHWKSKKNYTLNHAAERIKIYSKEKFNYNIYEIEF